MQNVHPMLQESWDEAAACAQIEYDQAVYQATQAAQAQAPVEPSDEPAPF